MYKPTAYFDPPLTTPESLQRHCASVPPGTLISRGALPPGLLIVRNFLGAAECAELLEYANGQAGTPATVQDTDAEGDAPRAHQSAARVTDYLDVTAVEPALRQLVDGAFRQIAAPHYNVRFEWFEPPALLRYRAGGHYVPHADAENWHAGGAQWRRALDRDFSLLVYLDEGYEGGELDFPNFRFRIKPQAGMLVCFPSDHRYVHAAGEVTAGVRHVLVSWAAIHGSARVAPPAERVLIE